MNRLEIARHRTELIQKVIDANPDAGNHRLASILTTTHSEYFPTKEIARSALRRRLGLSGDKLRSEMRTKASVKKDRTGPKTFSMPKSKAKPWVPVEVKAKTIAILSDIHFPKHDEAALAAAVEHIKKECEPDVVLLNGDIADAEEFSSWAKNPRAVNTEDALDTIRQGLLWIRDQFQNSRIIYKMGNHEERLDRYCWSRAPELVGLAHISWEGLLKIDNDLNKIPELADIEFVGEQRPIMLGKLPVFHGHELPKGLTNAVNPARGAFLRMIDTAMIGHHHRSSSHVEFNWKHEPINCWSVGCLCDLTPEYARINKWNHGFAIVEVATSGSFSVYNYKLMQDNEVVTA
jgi:predicted phosphodiesterase